MGARACPLGVAPYLDVVAGLDPTIGSDGASAARPFIAGTPEVAARVEALWNAGADQGGTRPLRGASTLAGIELICDRVLPLLRA